MRILHVTDLHFRKHWFEWVHAKAGEFDAVCVSGDLIDLFSAADTKIRDQIKWVRTWIRTFPTPLFACSGNHDWWMPIHGIADTDARGGWLRKMSSATVAVDGSYRDFAGLQFVCLPWLGMPNDNLSTSAAIIVAHSPPSRTEVARQKDNDGGSPILDHLGHGTRCFLTGHIHAPNRWFDRRDNVFCVNPGCDFSRAIPNHVVVDTDNNVALYFIDGVLAAQAEPIFDRKS